MSRNLPAAPILLLGGRGAAQNIAENLGAAYWLASYVETQSPALLLWNNVHREFATLADALGYDITERPQPKPATDEVA